MKVLDPLYKLIILLYTKIEEWNKKSIDESIDVFLLILFFYCIRGCLRFYSYLQPIWESSLFSLCVKYSTNICNLSSSHPYITYESNLSTRAVHYFIYFTLFLSYFHLPKLDPVLSCSIDNNLFFYLSWSEMERTVSTKLFVFLLISIILSELFFTGK